MKLSKEDLQKQLNAIAKQEEKEMIEREYPKFKEFEGRCFKTRNNYSCPEKPSDYWFLYTKITSVKKADIYDTRANGPASHYTGWSFQTDKYGRVNVEKEVRGYIHSLDKEISEKEFKSAWNKVIDGLNKMH